MVDIREQSPLAMAFVGDAVYSLLIREYLVTDKRHPINKLNKMSVNYVSAKGQFLALEVIKDILTEEEQNIIRRGKNTSKASVAKNASVEEWISSIEEKNAVWQMEEEIRRASEALAEAMLTAKFLQGIPVVGAIGGMSNPVIYRKVQQYASLKYKKRYLAQKRKGV